MKPSKESGKEPNSQPKGPAQTEERGEQQLDRALDDTFPASDPPTAVNPDSDAEDALEDELDDALDDTFPASDPPSTTQPGEK
jgi:hypothetical protein